MPLRQPVELRTRLHLVRARYPSTWAILGRKLQQADAWQALVQGYVDYDGRQLSADQAVSVRGAPEALALWERDCSLGELLQLLESQGLYDAAAFLQANLRNQTDYQPPSTAARPAAPAPPAPPPSGPPPPPPPQPPSDFDLDDAPMEISADQLQSALAAAPQIGQGGLAQVYLIAGSFLDNNSGPSARRCAVKVYRQDICQTVRQAILRSIGALSHLRHRCIARLIGYSFSPDDNQIFTVFDFYPNRDLRELLNLFADRDRWQLSNASSESRFHLGGTRLRMATEIASAVAFLHSAEQHSLPISGTEFRAFNFVHKDIKPSNILLGADWRCYLADLDFLDLTTIGTGRTLVGEQREEVLRVHTLGYRPPEDRVTCKWDVFSAGVTLLELLTGRPGEPSSSDQPVDSWLCRALVKGPSGPGQSPQPPPPQPGLQLSASLHAKICREALAPCLLDDYRERCTSAVLLNRLQSLLIEAEAEDSQRQGAGLDEVNCLEEFDWGQLDSAIRQSGEPIGAGGFGRVYKVSLPGSGGGRLAAVKQLLSTKATDQPLDSLQRQASLRHPHLLQLLGFAYGRNLLLVYELCEGGSLRGLIDAFEASRAPPASEFHLAGTRIRMAYELADALAYLHSLQEVELAACGEFRFYSLAHQDVKSSNVLLTGDWHCKLGDLDSMQAATPGSGNTLVEDRPMPSKPSSRYVTPGYHVPGESWSCKADVYALGVTLLELFTGRSAHSDYGEHELRLSFLKASSQPPSQPGLEIGARCYSDLCDAVFKPCLNLNAGLRPDSAEVLRQLDRFYKCCVQIP